MSEPVPSMRKRRQWPPFAGVIVMLVFTLAGPTANALRPRPPTAAEVMSDELNAVVEQRHARLVELLATGDQCRPAIAHELAKTLVFDGHSALAYATDYEQRCAPDPVVHAWGTAKIPHRHP